MASPARADGARPLAGRDPVLTRWSLEVGRVDGVDGDRSTRMHHYLISFPSRAMDVPAAEMSEVSDASHAVVREAKAAGVWVFGGGIDEEVPPVRVSADWTVTAGTYPETARIEGGYSVLRLADDAEARAWAARIARACRCEQEVRRFFDDPES